MSGFHCHNFAYLAAGDRAINALRRVSPWATHAVRLSPEIRCSDGRAVLCVEISRPYVWPDALRAELEGIDITGLNEYRRANPISADDDFDADSELDSERTLVRALTWLSAEAGGPVGYWHHAGWKGLIADVFIGVGPFARWENDSESQDVNWDESKPRSAYTAALWHIGARVPNVDERDSISRAFGQSRIPVADLSAEGQPLTQYSRDVSALTERLKRVYSAAPASSEAEGITVTAKWIARLKRIISR